jgi:hypothetical protein
MLSYLRLRCFNREYLSLLCNSWRRWALDFTLAQGKWRDRNPVFDAKAQT